MSTSDFEASPKLTPLSQFISDVLVNRHFANAALVAGLGDGNRRILAIEAAKAGLRPTLPEAAKVHVLGQLHDEAWLRDGAVTGA